VYKLALITGASSGLGEALSYALAQRGLSLILVGRNRQQLERVAAKIPTRTEMFVCDLSSAEERCNLLTLIREKVPDLVINNAGFGLYGEILEQTLQEAQDMLAVNAQAIMEISIEAARSLRARNKRGALLNISSAAAFFAYPTFCLYAASKAFVNAFSLAFDTEMRPHGIRILTVCPGQIATPFRSKAARRSDHFSALSRSEVLGECLQQAPSPPSPDCMTMSLEKAVRLILKHLDRQTPLALIDWRYRALVALSRLLPQSLRLRLLKRTLTQRYVHNVE
jgi:short-subunit dehydrogenase